MPTTISAVRDERGHLTIASDVLSEVTDWELVIPPDSSGYAHAYKKAFWLGGSDDGKYYFLAAAKDELVPLRDSVLAITEPLSRECSYLTEVMFRALAVTQRAGALSDKAAADILSRVSLPSYQMGGEFSPDLPKQWLSLPCELVVGFTLSEGAHVSRATFKEYRRDALREALEVVKGKRHDGILLRYLLHTRGVVPFLFWDLDAPLARRGQQLPQKREKVQVSVPWEAEADATLLEIYQHLPSRGIWSVGPPYFGEPRVRLRVGGRTEEEAIANWEKCARTLRRIAV